MFIAIQCAIQGNLSVKLIDPFTLQNILRNVTLQLPDGYKLIPGSKTENIHQYYQIAKVTVAATAHCIKLIISIPLETASQHFILYKITSLPECISFDKFVKHSVEHYYLGIQTSQRDYILFSETDFNKCSKDDIVICPADTTIYSAQRLSCVFSLYFQTVSHYHLCNRQLLLHYQTPTLRLYLLWIYHFPTPQLLMSRRLRSVNPSSSLSCYPALVSSTTLQHATSPPAICRHFLN